MPEKAVKKAFRSAEIFVSPDILREYREVPLTLEANTMTLLTGRVS
jgi:hypothetical protein